MFVDASESRTITYVMFSPRRRCVVVKYMYLRCDTSQMATREADPCKEGFVPFPKNSFGFEEKKTFTSFSQSMLAAASEIASSTT